MLGHGLVGVVNQRSRAHYSTITQVNDHPDDQQSPNNK